MSQKIHQVQAAIVKNEKITPTVYYLELSIPGLAETLRPGQFLHLRIGTGVDPLLRRPLSVYSLVKKNNGRHNIAVVYKVVGKGTKLLAERSARETVDILGPLGNGFTVRNGPVILVAGGMGVAPMVFLAQALLRRNNRPGGPTAAFIGMNTKKELVGISDLKKLGCAVRVSTDDGSQGYKGYVSDLFDEYAGKLPANGPRPYVYACGPIPMLKEVSRIIRHYGLSGQVSLDEMMGCGIGACLGCVIKTNPVESGPQRAEYKRICKDGPVFDSNEIAWEG